MTELTTSKPKGFLNMPKLPLAGFFRRLIAFVVDMIVLMAGVYLISRTFPELPLVLGAGYRYATGALCFAYFVLFNGPFGGGRTVGKMLIGIKVTSYDGEPITYAQALLRTFIMMPFFFAAPLVELSLEPIESSKENYVKGLLTVLPFVAVTLANCLVIPFNPFKQGVHDYLARSLVRPYDKTIPHMESFEELAASVGSGWLKFHRQPQISGSITFIMVYTLLAFATWPHQRDDVVQIYDKAYEMRKVDGFRNARVDLIPRERETFLMFSDAYQPFRPPPGFEGEFSVADFLFADTETTGTVTLVTEVSREGPWLFDPTDPPYVPFTEQVMSLYYYEVLPGVLRKSAASQREEIRNLIREWSESEVRLVFVFTRRVRSFPPVYEANQLFTSYAMDFPALDLDLGIVGTIELREVE